MSLKAQLAKAKAAWSKAKEAKPDFDNVVPDGVYVGKITKAELGESESSGRLQVAFAAIVSGGEYKGERVNWWSGLKTEQNFMYLQRDLVRLGMEVPESVDDLGTVLSEIESSKPSIRFRVKTDGEFTNIRILKKVGATESEDDGGVEEESEDEEIEEAEEKPSKTKSKKEKEEAPEDPEPEPEPEEEAEVEVEEEAEEEETPTLEVGVRVAFDSKGKEMVGKVVDVNNDEELAKVKTDEGVVYKNIKYEKLRPAPKAKVKKK